VALDPFVCTRHDVAQFAAAAAGLGVRYLGLCCGAAPHHIRAMSDASKVARATPLGKILHALSLKQGGPLIRGVARGRRRTSLQGRPRRSDRR